MPHLSLFSEVKKWVSDFRIIWDKIPIVPSEAEELADFGGIA